MARGHRTWSRTVSDRGRRRPGVPARDNRRGRCGATPARAVRSRRLPLDGSRPGRSLRRRSSQPAHSPSGRSRWTRRGIGVPRMFDPDQFHDPEFRTLVLAARAVLAERVHRGVATPPERLAVAALDEMPDEDDRGAGVGALGRVPGCGALGGARDAGALRRHRRGAGRRSRPRGRRRRRDDALTTPAGFQHAGGGRASLCPASIHRGSFVAPCQDHRAGRARGRPAAVIGRCEVARRRPGPPPRTPAPALGCGRWREPGQEAFARRARLTGEAEPGCTPRPPPSPGRVSSARVGGEGRILEPPAGEVGGEAVKRPGVGPAVRSEAGGRARP